MNMKIWMVVSAVCLYIVTLIGIVSAASDIQIILSAISFSGGTAALGLAGIMARLESRPTT